MSNTMTGVTFTHDYGNGSTQKYEFSIVDGGDYGMKVSISDEDNTVWVPVEIFQLAQIQVNTMVRDFSKRPEIEDD